MKYFLSFALLCTSLFAFCQEGENIAPLQNEAGGEQPLTESDQALPEEPSLEEFLKRQEELWLQEKADLKAAEDSSQSASLPPPSVLTEEVQPEEEEQKSVKPAPESKKTNQTAAPRKKRESASALIQPASVPEAELINSPEQKPLEESPAEGKNDWRALLKGCVFAVLLGVGVWLLSKYQ